MCVSGFIWFELFRLLHEKVSLVTLGKRIRSSIKKILFMDYRQQFSTPLCSLWLRRMRVFSFDEGAISDGVTQREKGRSSWSTDGKMGRFNEENLGSTFL